MDCFNKKYTTYHNKYIVPFHSSNQLEMFGKQWEPGDMDTLIFLNGSSIKKELLGEE